MKKKRIIGEFVGFLGDRLPEPIEISDETIKQMRVLVDSDIDRIKENFRAQLKRLDQFLKNEVGVIPKEDEFALWFYKQKSFVEWGERLPKIDDDKMIEFSLLYLNDLKKRVKNRNLSITISENLWAGSEEALEFLALMLSKEYKFISDTQKDEFITLFSNPERNKINWKSTTTTLVYLIVLLIEKKFISSTMKMNSFIENNFLSNGRVIRNIKQTRSNIKDNKSGKPQNCTSIDSIINTLPK
ncbi:MAG: hypothetical protein J0L80_12345 [Chitinophagales bacterium]|nr:hypothetical protein [Chitinophagales bacterium]